LARSPCPGLGGEAGGRGTVEARGVCVERQETGTRCLCPDHPAAGTATRVLMMAQEERWMTCAACNTQRWLQPPPHDPLSSANDTATHLCQNLVHSAQATTATTASPGLRTTHPHVCSALVSTLVYRGWASHTISARTRARPKCCHCTSRVICMGSPCLAGHHCGSSPMHARGPRLAACKRCTHTKPCTPTPIHANARARWKSKDGTQRDVPGFSAFEAACMWPSTPAALAQTTAPSQP
jgi:hypothetical protein